MIKEALIKKLEGDIEVAKADLSTFLASPIGVAEHIDYVVKAEKRLESLANAEDKSGPLLKLKVKSILYITKKPKKSLTK